MTEQNHTGDVAQGPATSLRDAVDRIVVSAMSWQPSENGPSFDSKFTDLMARFDAALAAQSPAAPVHQEDACATAAKEYNAVHFPCSAGSAVEQHEDVTLQICFEKVVKDRDHLREALSEAHRALVAFKDAVIASGHMKGREYVGLGIQVNDALDKARIALSSEAPQ